MATMPFPLQQDLFQQNNYYNLGTATSVIIGQGMGSLYQGGTVIATTTTTSATANVYFYPQDQYAQCVGPTFQQQISYGWGIGQINVEPETKRQRVERKLACRRWNMEEKMRRGKAKELLLSVLTSKQRDQFEEDQHFELQVNERIYRIRPGSRVERLDPKSKKILSYFCIHPSHEHGLPFEDVAVSQKLMLETAESEFLRIANETRVAA